MLDVCFDNGTTDRDEVIINPIKYFEAVRKPAWFNEPFIKRMILEVDNARAIQDEFILSCEGMAITPFHLSGGVKTLICIYKMPEKLWYGSTMGDNCCGLLAEIARKTDVRIMLRHFMDDCEDVLYMRGRKITIEEYEDAYCEYCEAVREEMKKYE